MLDPLHITFLILAVTIIGFVSDRLPLDLVGLLSVLALYLTGILTLEETLAGFSDPLVLLIGGLFVLGGAMLHTGMADRVGAWLTRQSGDSYPRFITLVVLLSALLSAVISSTGTVAVLLPAVIAAAQSSKRSVSQCLLPLAFGALVGGTLTLIGTTPNLIVSASLSDAGLEPFGFFSFTPIGIALLVFVAFFFAQFGQKWLPGGDEKIDSSEIITVEALAESYRLDHHFQEVFLPRDHELVGRSPKELRLAQEHSVTLLGWFPGEQKAFCHATASGPLAGNSTLLLQAEEEAADQFCHRYSLRGQASDDRSLRQATERSGVVELLLIPRSRLIGRTLKDLQFTERYQLRVLGLKRRGKVVEGPLSELELHFGDSLLVGGPWSTLEAVANERDNFVAVGIPEEFKRATKNQGAQNRTLAILAGLLLLLNLESVPPAISALLAAAALVTTKCLSSRQAYRSINWESLILIATLLPMATALRKTGGVDLMADLFLKVTADLPSAAALMAFFLVTALLSQVLSNTATTVIIAPVALTTATALAISPRPLLMAVAIGASCAFLSPVASPVNTMVVVPGKYRFLDFLKVGTPLLLGAALLASLLIPLFFPYR